MHCTMQCCNNVNHCPILIYFETKNILSYWNNSVAWLKLVSPKNYIVLNLSNPIVIGTFAVVAAVVAAFVEVLLLSWLWFWTRKPYLRSQGTIAWHSQWMYLLLQIHAVRVCFVVILVVGCGARVVVLDLHSNVGTSLEIAVTEPIRSTMRVYACRIIHSSSWLWQ